jgi:hypothetical protein
MSIRWGCSLLVAGELAVGIAPEPSGTIGQHSQPLDGLGGIRPGGDVPADDDDCRPGHVGENDIERRQIAGTS